MNNSDTVVLAAPEPVDWITEASKTRLLIGLLSAASIVVLDFFIVLACLPAIEHTLGATKAQLQLILASYAVANASLLVVGGRLGDALGRRRVMTVGVALFAAASLACGLATSAWALIAFRVLQGLAGALVQPQVLGLLSVNFESHEKPRIFGLYAAALGFAGIAAQLLGGLFVGLLPDDLGWRLCFIVSVPLCCFALLCSARANEGAHTGTRGIDLVGALLLGVGLGCICTFLTVGREQGWPTWSFYVLAAGIVSVGLLLGWLSIGSRSGADRVIPNGILRENAFWLALLRIFVFYCGVASLYFVLALQLRLVSGFTAVQVGLFFAWLAVCFVSTSTVKRFKSAFGNHSLHAGLACLASGHLMMLYAGSHADGFQQVLAFTLSCSLQGAGIGLLMGPLMASALSRVSLNRASTGGGIASSTQQVGNSIGVSAIGFAYFVAGSSTTSLESAVLYLLLCVLCLFALVSVPSAST